MKRRGFLQLLGGAMTAPFLPAKPLVAATRVTYPAAALHAAIYHAQSRVNFSVYALAQKLGLSLDQAEALMAEMSSRGILGPLQGTTQSGRWALSKVWKRPFVDAAAAQKAARSGRKSDLPEASEPDPWAVDLRPMLKHLQGMARAQGHSLHPRAAAQIV